MKTKYQCSEGHAIEAPPSVAIKRCPVCVRGKPCPGTITKKGIK